MADHTLTGRSVADLLKQASDQTATLVHQELEPAKAELTTMAKLVKLGAGMFAGAGVFGVYAFAGTDGGCHLDAQPGGHWLAGRIDRGGRIRCRRGRAGAWRQEQSQGEHAAAA